MSTSTTSSCRLATKPLSLAILAGALFLGTSSQALAESSLSNQKGAVQLIASLSHGTLPNHASSEVYASIKMTGSAFVSEDRAPLNVSLVMDRSSSMAGEKIKQSRQAALKFLEQLGPSDRISIISYGSDVSVESSPMYVTEKNREKLRGIIRELSVGGMTNLSGGFQQGCDLVASSLEKGSVNRVILMSDGVANRGITEPLQLAGLAGECYERGVSSTTIGLGLGYNEDVMTQMAVAGAGNYYFIDDEEAMASVFQQEATGLSATVARSASLEIELGKGVELLKLHGYKYKEKGNKVTVSLAEFSSKQKKDVLMRLSVSAQESGERSVIGVKLVYEDLLDAKKVVKKGDLTAAVSSDEKVVASHLDREVYTHAQKLEVAQTMTSAMNAYEKGDQKEAERLIQEQRTQMQQAKERYALEGDDLEAFDRVDKELDETNTVIQNNAASSAPAQRLRKAKKKRSYDIQKSESLF